MPTDIVFNPAAADEARRAKIVVVSPTNDSRGESPRGQSAQDPLYDLHRPENLPTPDAALAAGRERLRQRQESAAQPENAAALAYRWAAPIELVNRLLALENLGAPQYVIEALTRLENTMTGQIEILTARCSLIERAADELAAHVHVMEGNVKNLMAKISGPGPLDRHDLHRLQSDLANLKVAMDSLQEKRK